MVKIRIGGIIKNDHLAKIGVMSIPDQPGIAGVVLRALGQQHINVQFIVQCIDLNNEDHIIFCVDRDDLDAALAIVERLLSEVQAERVIHNRHVALISIFGPDFRERPNIAGTFFSALAAKGINILAISTSISTLSCIIDAHCLDDAVAAVTEAFELP
ncbi:MAG: ACT domain-containing protein [Chloroflexi bacterium]|nr:ACT domain-containing protein [Chloroflexota bacterium]